MTYPVLRANLRVVPVDEESVVVVGGDFDLRLKGAIYRDILQYADGSRTVDEIVELVAPEVSIPAMTKIYYAFERLKKQKVLDEYPGDINIRPLALWHLSGLDTEAVLSFSSRRVAVFGDAAESVKNILVAEGLSIAEDNDAELAIVLVDDYLSAGVKELHRRLYDKKIPTLFAKVNGNEPLLGPLIVPGITACYECLAVRQRHNRDMDVWLNEARGIDFPVSPVAVSPSLLSAAAGIIAYHAVLYLGTGSSPLQGAVYSLFLPALTGVMHTLTKRPECELCGIAAAEKSLHPPVLYPVPKPVKSDSGYRSTTPEQTYEKYKHLVSGITGVVNKLERITDVSDPVLHVYVSGQNMATKHNRFEHLRRNLRTASCGKGMTDIQAKVSGMCEAIERYSGVWRGNESHIYTTYGRLGNDAIHPNAIMLFSDDQYRCRDERNAAGGAFSFIPEQFDEQQPCRWSPVWSMTEQRYKYIPSGLLYYSYDRHEEGRYLLPDSNGCSTGNTIEEAILQGFIELVERDAVATWWYNRTRQPRVDIDSFEHPYVRRYMEAHRALGREVWVIDVTNDVGIPVFVAFSRKVDGAPEEIAFAPGAHLDPEIALLRALTEVNQMLPGMERDSDKGTYAFDEPSTVWWWQNATKENQPYIVPSESAPSTTSSTWSAPPTETLLDDIEYCRSVVERCGLEMLFLDQTRGDVGMPVVKVIVPGLRHFWARYAPGRLYSVPVELGRLARPLAEAELNPIDMFI